MPEPAQTRESPSETRSRHGLSADDARSLCERVLSLATADNTRVNIDSGVRGFTRTATNRITTAGTTSDVTIRITSVFGKRIASVETNRLDEASLTRTVKECEDLARISPENPEYLPELGAQTYTEVNGYYPTTGELTTESRARAAALALKAATSAKMVAAGFIDVRAGSQAVATSKGLFAYASGTGVASTLTVRTPDGSSSGWAGDEGADWTTIESQRIADDAVRKCQQWRGKTSLEPGRYDVVLEPTAVGMLMLRMQGAFDARQADEGRSYFSKKGGGNRVGEKLFDERVTIVSDPAAANAETSPFAVTGLPVAREAWIEKGVLKSLSYSRFWAQQKQVAPKTPPTNLIMSGGDASLDDMIKSVKRGVLLTRFWYIRPLNPRVISHTGLTRDGTFLIENGKIARPVTNFRFNQSLADLLQNVEMLGRPTRVASSENSSVGPPIVVPALTVRGFSLSSVSDAI
jgi:predicted Zn-dependent protease